MRQRYGWGVLAVLLLIMLGGCSVADMLAPTPKETLFLSPLALPHHTAYVLSGRPSGLTALLTLLDANGWQVVRTVQLPPSYTTHLSRDPQGRLWIGYQGVDWDEYRVQVYAPDGQLVRTLRPCRNPDSGVQFGAGKAFVVCNERGFFASVAVIDLATFAIENISKLEVPNEIYFVYGSGGDEQQVLVLGIIHRPGGLDSNALMFINPHRPSGPPRLEVFNDTSIAEVLIYQGKYYLLNVFGGHFPRSAAKDILIVTPGAPSSVTSIAAPAPSPTWGKLVGDLLFTYHNPAWNQYSEIPRERTLARLDLKTGVSQVWPLPDNWDANDLEVVNGKIILLKDDGVYAFDPANGQLQKRVNIPFAQQIIVTP